MSFVANQAGRWFSPRDLTAGARLRLFCLPHAGSGSAAFYRWRRGLPDGVDLVPVLLPGREVRLSEPSFTSADALVAGLSAAIRPYLDRPYAIFGHSMGALLGFELARAVRAVREPSWLFLSGRIAAQVPPPHPPLHELPERELVEALRVRYGGLPQTLLDDPELRELFLPIVRADLTVVETYCYREQPPLACPISVFAGEEDGSVSPEGLEAWRAQTSGPFAAKRLPGDHFYQLGESAPELVAELSRCLDAILAS